MCLVPVCGEGVDPMGVEMVGRYEEEFLKQRERGVKVRGMVLCKYVTVFFFFIFLTSILFSFLLFFSACFAGEKKKYRKYRRGIFTLPLIFRIKRRLSIGI